MPLAQQSTRGKTEAQKERQGMKKGIKAAEMPLLRFLVRRLRFAQTTTTKTPSVTLLNYQQSTK